MDKLNKLSFMDNEAFKREVVKYSVYSKSLNNFITENLNPKFIKPYHRLLCKKCDATQSKAKDLFCILNDVAIKHYEHLGFLMIPMDYSINNELVTYIEINEENNIVNEFLNKIKKED